MQNVKVMQGDMKNIPIQKVEFVNGVLKIESDKDYEFLIMQ